MKSCACKGYKKIPALLILTTIILLSVFITSALAATFINIGTGTTGGTYYPVGAAMAKIWNDNINDMRANAQSTGGTAQNIQLLAKGETEIGFADGLYYYAYLGKGAFEGNPQEGLRALLPLYPEPIHFLVPKGSAIKTVADLKGKRVSTGAVGSGTEMTAKTLLRLAGLDPDRDVRCEPLGLSDTASAMADKHIDAALTVGALGIAGVVEMCTLGIVEFVDLPDDLVGKVTEEMPYMNAFTIPENFYRGQDKPVKTFGSWNVLIVTEKLDDDLAYQMTKALFENKENLTVVSKTMENMAPDNISYIKIPLHPGAQKYFKEIGAVK
ncbi:MAG: TAXI family TRAP transporter solute-binding subunit [Synergistaceae bacterium]|jgi:TRAP transporter TAXI family solute receptor|nr:TAXI family TRAP transporter solute-binding subunit [Synergistaceae bacterium]